VVASKGTALTDNQVKIIARSCESVVLCFDTDIAGDKAARRGIEMLDAAGLIVKGVSLGKFKDPDEFVQRDPVGFKVALKNAANFYDFLIYSAKKRYDSSTVYGKKKIGQELLPVVSKISDEVVRAHYMGKIAGVLGVDPSLIDNSEKYNNETVVNNSDRIDNAGRVERLEKYFLALYLVGDSLHHDFFKILDKNKTQSAND